MAILARIVIAAVLVSIAFVDIAGASPADTYNSAAVRARAHIGHQRRVVGAASGEVERRNVRKRCRAGTTTSLSTTTPSLSTSTDPVATLHHAITTTSRRTSKHPEPTTNTGGGKKGLAWSSSDKYISEFVNSGVQYIYNWGAAPPQGHGLKAMSMLWGQKNLEEFRKHRENYPILMGPNEFNLVTQADMSVQQVVDMWNSEIRPFSDKILISPSVTSAPSGISQLKEFFNTCGGPFHDYCGAKGISLHYYSTNSSQLEGYVKNAHAEFPDINIWITEFACQGFSGDDRHCTQDEAVTFMKDVIYFCETHDYIAMYSPYGFSPDLGNVDSVNALMTPSGTPTALGNVFLTN